VNSCSLWKWTVRTCYWIGTRRSLYPGSSSCSPRRLAPLVSASQYAIGGIRLSSLCYLSQTNTSGQRRALRMVSGLVVGEQREKVLGLHWTFVMTSPLPNESHGVSSVLGGCHFHLVVTLMPLSPPMGTSFACGGLISTTFVGKAPNMPSCLPKHHLPPHFSGNMTPTIRAPCINSSISPS
jgi:hypothetical protein